MTVSPLGHCDVELYFRKGGGWLDNTTPYIKVIFKNVRQFNREKGFSLRYLTIRCEEIHFEDNSGLEAVLQRGHQ